MVTVKRYEVAKIAMSSGRSQTCVDPRNHVLDSGAHWCHPANTIKRPVRGDDAVSVRVYEELRMSQIIIIIILNNNNNNSRDNVYGAVIMTKVITRVHPVHLMNVD